MKIHGPRPPLLLWSSRPPLFTCKNIPPEKKQNQVLPGTIEKNKFLLFKKTVYGSFR